MKIKSFINALIVLSISINCYAQYNPENQADFQLGQCNDKLIFLKVETMPELLGGTERLVKEINSKVKFDRDKKTRYLTCKVAVNCEGSVYDSEIIINNLLEDKESEILEVVNRSCKFTSAKHKDEPVDCYYYFYFYVKNSKLKSYKM